MQNFELGTTKNEREEMIAILKHFIAIGELEDQDLEHLSDKELNKLFDQTTQKMNT